MLKGNDEDGNLRVEVSPFVNAIDPEQVAQQAEHVRALARRLLDDAAAEDVVQDACLAALRRPPAPGVPLRAWLVRVVRNLAARRCRDQERQRRALVALAERHAERSAMDVQERVRLHARLIRAVQRLPEPYATTLLLRFFDGMPPRVIAVRTGVSAAAVSTRVHRGLAMLRKRLQAENESGTGWMAGLLPLAMHPERGASAWMWFSAGGLVMGLKSWVAICTVAFIAAIALLWGGSFDDASHRSARDASGEPVLLARGAKDLGPIEEADDEADVDPLAVADRDLDLHGTVVNARGRPVPNATITSYSEPWQAATLWNLDRNRRERPGPSTTTAADGTFLMRLSRGAEVTLRVNAAGHSERRVPDCMAGQRVTIELRRGGDAVVRARDERGAPIAGAAVRLFTSQAKGLTILEWRAETDGEGMARFRDLPVGPRISVEVAHPRFAPPLWQEIYTKAGESEDVIVVLPTGRTLVGTVTDAETGAPIPRARIGLGWTFHKAVFADDQGRYELHGYSLDSGYTAIYASAPGYPPVISRPPFGETLDVELGKGTTVVGRILAADGSPIGKAYVAAVEGAGGISVFARSDDDGSFRLAGIRKKTRHSLVAFGPEQGRVVYDFVAGQTATHDLGDIRLPAARAIEGVVTLPDGSPATGIPVELRGSNDDRNRLQPDAQPPAAPRSGAREVRRTDDLGRFRFPGLAPGTYALMAQPATRKWTGLDVVLTVEADVRDARIALTGGHRLRVRVEDTRGRPIPGVNVTVGCEDLYQFGQYTGPTGTFEIDSDSNPTSVEVSTPFQSEAWILPPLQKLEPGEKEVRIVLTRAARARGIVVDPDGKPMPQIPLEVFREGRPFAQMSHFSGNQVWTNPEGRFNVIVPSAGTVDIIAFERVQEDGTIWQAEVRGVQAGDMHVELRMAPVASGRTLRVRAFHPDGSPAKDVQVYARAGGKFIEGSNVRTDAEGRGTMADLPAARMTLYARATPESTNASGWHPWSQYPVTPKGQEIEIRLKNSRLFSGRVVDASGKAVPGADVGAWHGQRPPALVKSDEDGRFTLRLDPDETGVLRVWARLGGRMAPPRVAALEAENFVIELR